MASANRAAAWVWRLERSLRDERSAMRPSRRELQAVAKRPAVPLAPHQRGARASASPGCPAIPIAYRTIATVPTTAASPYSWLRAAPDLGELFDPHQFVGGLARIAHRRPAQLFDDAPRRRERCRRLCSAAARSRRRRRERRSSWLSPSSNAASRWTATWLGCGTCLQRSRRGKRGTRPRATGLRPRRTQAEDGFQRHHPRELRAQ